MERAGKVVGWWGNTKSLREHTDRCVFSCLSQPGKETLPLSATPVPRDCLQLSVFQPSPRPCVSFHRRTHGPSPCHMLHFKRPGHGACTTSALVPSPCEAASPLCHLHVVPPGHLMIQHKAGGWQDRLSQEHQETRPAYCQLHCPLGLVHGLQDRHRTEPLSPLSDSRSFPSLPKEPIPMIRSLPSP